MSIHARIKELRLSSGLNQEEFATSIGLKRGNYAQIETGKQKPTLETVSEIVRIYNKTYDWVIEGKEIAPNIAPIVAPKSKNTDKKGIQIQQTDVLVLDSKDDDLQPVPVIDIKAAAGGGYMNPDYISTLEYMKVPRRFLKRGHIYFWIRNRGDSMAPGIQDGSLILIRLLEKSEWAELGKELVCLVVADGQAYLKRVKNRLDRGFVILMSDNPDKATYADVTYEAHEISTMFYAEAKFEFKFPNIHNTYYSRLQRLEDSVDDLTRELRTKRVIDKE